MPRCLLIDLDGTLVDSEIANCRAFLDLLPDLPLTLPQLIASYRGVQLDRIIEDLTQRHGVAPDADFVPRYRAHVAGLFERELAAFPGVAEALDRIDLPICVASSAPRDKIATALQITGLAGFFGDRLYSAYDVRAWKPDPAVFLAAATGMGVTPDQCLVIEDSAVGLAAARAARMPVLHFTPHEDGDQDAQAEGRFTHWQQLPDLLAAAPWGVAIRG
ncbi:HAD-IA family hydrolase [Paracoccus siganidrum]|uniref:HAD family hydrolase n=1 Tax=Paracoccus siganidrum TaxID=1276757 RepID=A0A419A5V1_9RHOB|nr:HAD-IA family hydrolase [Paracoccus siganidrum]RJL11674.1 HAD family hydrolase [Paracoccus siganidrum]RMC41187.1 haloacid dehalogenase [Paracoccus siganidrum]